MRVLLILVLVVVVAILIALILGVTARTLRSRLNATRDQKHRQELAGVAPAVLHGDPLLPTVINQGRLLQKANNAFSVLLANDLQVFMPNEVSDKLRAWQQEYDKSLDANSQQ